MRLGPGPKCQLNFDKSLQLKEMDRPGFDPLTSWVPAMIVTALPWRSPSDQEFVFVLSVKSILKTCPNRQFVSFQS